MEPVRSGALLQTVAYVHKLYIFIHSLRRPALEGLTKAFPKRFKGVSAPTDNANSLFKVRLSGDGRDKSTTGVDGVPLGCSSQLRHTQHEEQGR